MDNIRFYAIVVGFSLIAIGITFLIERFTRKNGLKFIPAAIFAVAAVGCFIKSAYFSQSFQDIAFMLMGILATILFVVSFITAVLLGKNKTKTK